MDSRDTQVVHQLFLLNITLQLFDGAATYFGVRHPWYEANPLIAAVMTQIGIGAGTSRRFCEGCDGFNQRVSGGDGYAGLFIAIRSWGLLF